jgi:hypothetical protein
MREDLAHDDEVCELCDEASGSSAVRTRQHVEREDTSQELSAHVERDERERAEVLCAVGELGAKAA